MVRERRYGSDEVEKLTRDKTLRGENLKRNAPLSRSPRLTPMLAFGKPF